MKAGMKRIALVVLLLAAGGIGTNYYTGQKATPGCIMIRPLATGCYYFKLTSHSKISNASLNPYRSKDKSTGSLLGHFMYWAMPFSPVSIC